MLVKFAQIFMLLMMSMCVAPNDGDDEGYIDELSSYTPMIPSTSDKPIIVSAGDACVAAAASAVSEGMIYQATKRVSPVLVHASAGSDDVINSSDTDDDEADMNRTGAVQSGGGVMNYASKGVKDMYYRQHPAAAASASAITPAATKINQIDWCVLSPAAKEEFLVNTRNFGSALSGREDKFYSWIFKRYRIGIEGTVGERLSREALLKKPTAKIKILRGLSYEQMRFYIHMFLNWVSYNLPIEADKLEERKNLNCQEKEALEKEIEQLEAEERRLKQSGSAQNDANTAALATIATNIMDKRNTLTLLQKKKANYEAIEINRSLILIDHSICTAVRKVPIDPYAYKGK